MSREGEYRVTVGLEIHAELKTRTKMFCSCLNDPDEKEPNKNVCAVCLAHPGTLPVINKEAVRKVLLVGAAVGGTLPDYTEFDRKNYFYPDIPKGYQISQYKYPLVGGGLLLGVELTRVHLEEDTARSQHEGANSLVDYNRAGVPLMELVTEPVIHDAQTAGAFARELQLLLRSLGAGEANMEKGEMRVEANISVSKNEKLGTKVEVKNLNSFRSVERAIAFELKRQQELLKAGEKVIQETRGWDEARQATFSQRKKERAHDYRYFPDPDLPKLTLSDLPEFSASALKKDLPELPWQKRARYEREGLNPEYVDMFVADERFGNLYERTAALVPAEARKLAANYIGSDIAGLVSKAGDSGLPRISPEGLAAVMTRLHAGELSSRGAKDALVEVFEHGGDLATVSQKYIQQSDAGALEAIAQKVVDANPGPAADFKAGKEAALQYLVGQGMKESKGSANPQALRAAIQKILA
jgi:aspartyl-tRNA(Asn)/glutamyl-tRNA(Gln) amidotransferase subunit B